MASIDLEETRNQARQILDSRIEVVSELVIARQRVNDLRVQLAEAEREDKRAYVRATREGWGEDELKKLGLDNHAAVKRRKRSAMTGSPSSETNTTSGATE